MEGAPRSEHRGHRPASRRSVTQGRKSPNSIEYSRNRKARVPSIYTGLSLGFLRRGSHEGEGLPPGRDPGQQAQRQPGRMPRPQGLDLLHSVESQLVFNARAIGDRRLAGGKSTQSTIPVQTRCPRDMSSRSEDSNLTAHLPGGDEKAIEDRADRAGWPSREWRSPSALSRPGYASACLSFGDLDQWLLKVLLFSCSQGSEWGGSRGAIRNLAQLARRAAVTPPLRSAVCRAFVESRRESDQG